MMSMSRRKSFRRRPHPAGRRRLAFAVIWLLLIALASAACSGEEVIIKTADGVELTAEDIDRNPLALMPGGALGVFNIEVPALLSSAAGERMSSMTQARLPVPPSAGFVPARDLQRVVLGLYSFQGVDFMGVASGSFDMAAIDQAAAGTEATPLGTPLVRVEYAGRHFYVSANIGFVVLTSKTVIFGNETGIRRALDRIESGRVTVDLPPEVEALMEQPGAPLAFASDARHDPQVAALMSQMPFLNGMKMLRMIGNFDPPGMNLAGTLTYDDAATAEAGRASLQQVHQNIATIGLIAAAFGVAQPIQKLEIQVIDSSLQVSMALDANAATGILDLLATTMGSGGQPQ